MNFGVVGLGRFGTSVALTLEQLGYPVLALDSVEAHLSKVKDYLTSAKLIDTTDKQALQESGITNCQTVIVAIGEDMKSSVLTALNLKELGVKNIVAKAHSDEHARILEKIGCNNVLLPEKESGIRLANQLTSSDILEFIEVSPDYKVEEINSPKDFVGKKLGELDLRKQFQVIILAIRHPEGTIIIPTPEEEITKRDTLVVLSKTEDMSVFKKKFGV